MDPRKQVNTRPTELEVQNLRTLVWWALIAFLAYRLAETLAGTLLIFALAIFLAIILDRPIRFLDRKGLSRSLSVLTIVVLLAGLVTLVLSLSVRPVLTQVHEIAQNAPAYAKAIEDRIQAFTGKYPYLEKTLDNGDVGRWLSEGGKRVVSQIGRFSVSVLGALFGGVLVLVTALYTVLDPKPLLRGVIMAAPRPYQRPLLRTVIGSARQIQTWAAATVRLMVIIGVACGVGLWLLGVKWALVFGILAGVGEAIPTIGPILTAIPPALVAFADNPVKAVYVLILFFVVQQVENHLLVPRIMAAALQLHPVSVLFFVVALGAMLGPVGVLLAAPACAVVKVAYREFRADAERRAEQARRILREERS